MTPDQLHQLVAQGEGPTLEFKRSTKTLKAAFQTLCAFLNGAGGTVAIGVDDKGKLVGQEVGDRTLQEVARLAGELEPPVSITTERVALGKTKEVLLLRADPHQVEGPVTFDGRPYERVENTTRRMPQATYERLLRERSGERYAWERQPSPGLRLQDLDEERIRSFVQAAQSAGNLEDGPLEDSGTVLDRLELRVGGVLNNAAAALFLRGRHIDYPQCFLQMARFRGVDKSEFLDQAPPLYGGAFRLLEEAQVFCRRHIPVAGRIPPDDFRRVDTPAIPFEGLREILINALIHRDYAIAGANVQVAIFDDRLEVWSPGNLPRGVTIEQLLGDHTSVRRNRLVADAFFRAGMIERWGRGTNKVAELCRAADVSPPEFRHVGIATVVTFRSDFGQTAPRLGPLTPGELRAARKRAGWTQADLAQRVGTTPSAISHWERGTKALPSERRVELEELLRPYRDQ